MQRPGVKTESAVGSSKSSHFHRYVHQISPGHRLVSNVYSVSITTWVMNQDLVAGMDIASRNPQ